VAVTDDAQEYEGNIVVAADGVHSALRGQVCDDQLVVEGYVAYRGTLRAGDIDMALDLDATTIFVAPDCHITQYPVDSPAEAEDLTISHAAVFRSERFRQGQADWGTADELIAATADWIPGLRKVVDVLPKGKHWVMYDREPISNWVDGRMVLVGDAAHPMLQYAGQGGAQALEDAVALTRAVREYVVDQHDPRGWAPALTAFSSRRSPRAARVQSYARQAGDIMHVSGLARQLRDARYHVPEVTDFRSLEGLEWLYDE
jgi:salicylate hydroxylase